MNSTEASGFPLPATNVTQLTSYGEVATCVLDSLSGSWLNFFLMPRCFIISKTLEGRVINTLVGIGDIAHITAGFAFMFFLYYMIKPPEKDAHYHCNIFSHAEKPTLKEAVKKDSMLPFLLASNRVMQPAFDDILITAEKLGLDVSFESFYVTKEVYNRIAKQHNFQQLK